MLGMMGLINAVTRGASKDTAKPRALRPRSFQGRAAHV